MRLVCNARFKEADFPFVALVTVAAMLIALGIQARKGVFKTQAPDIKQNLFSSFAFKRRYDGDVCVE